MTIAVGAEPEPAAPGTDGMDDDALLEAGRRVLRLEADAVQALAGRLGPDFVAAVRLLHETRGRTLVSGIGKSGIIARKIAATLTSTGTPATFLHPVESLHGDLGLVGDADIAILVTKSGESGEMGAFIEHLSRRGVILIALTGGRDSAAARVARIALDCSVREEACPHDLAPTTSTTAALAMGDALAVTLLQLRGFTREDFARLHPGGALGRKLTLRVHDVMQADDLPALAPDASMRECIVLLAKKRGTVAIVDEERVVGVITAGDLTRLMERTANIFDVLVSSIMTLHPRVVGPDALAAAAIYQMETHGIMAMPVVDDERRLVGMVHLHDLLRSGVV